MKSAFSPEWKKSTQTRKQRKYQMNAPLHVRQKFMHVHLSKELAKKHGTRAAQLRTGDRVKILRGVKKGISGKIERIDLKMSQVFITGIETIKKDGSKVLYPLTPSNLIITELTLEDKKRKAKLSTEKNDKKPSQKN
jgi:large subunit ribosomal protein L24